MKNKEPIKIKLTTVIILFLIFIIIMAGIYFFVLKNNEEQNSEGDNNSKDFYQNNEVNNNQKEIYPNSQLDNAKQEENVVYSIKNKKCYLYEEANSRDENYRGMKLLEYDNSNNDYAEIYYILYDYTTEPSFYYTLEITDESNNNLLLEGKKEEQIIGGMVSPVKIKKVKLDSSINISIYEKNEQKINNSARIEVDLKTDLEKQVKIDQSPNLKNGNLGDVKFKYIDSKYVYFGTTSHAYSTKLVGENSSLPIKIQYGNYLESEEHIDFSYDKNVNNLSLEDAFESLVSINKNFGQYGLSDTYGMDITNKQGEVLETVVISYEEMMKLCNGITIEKNGKTYTKESFNGYAHISMLKDKNVEIGNGINAIKYSFESDDNFEYYMFIYKDNIYNLKVPVNKRINTEVEQFLDSLELN